MCSCHSIPECCVMFSGVNLSMGSFVLFGKRRASRINLFLGPLNLADDIVRGSNDRK